MRALDTQSVNAEDVGFASASQIGRLRTRVRGCARKSQETRYLISSAEPERLDTDGLLDTKRGYWAIEAALHYRLDDTLAEDQRPSALTPSRTDTGNVSKDGGEFCLCLA